MHAEDGKNNVPLPVMRTRGSLMASSSPRRPHSFYEGGIRSPAIQRGFLSPTAGVSGIPLRGLSESPSGSVVLPHGLVEGARVYTRSSSMFGTVRYVGEIRDRSGIWVGIELDMPSGKNSGEGPDGEVYFQCLPNHGLFVRPNKCTVLHDSAPRSVPPPTGPLSSSSLARPRTPSALKKLNNAADPLPSSPRPVLPRGSTVTTPHASSTSIPSVSRAGTRTPLVSSIPLASSSTSIATTYNNSSLVPELAFGNAGLTDQALMELTAENVLQSEYLRERIAEEVKEQARKLARTEVQAVEQKLEELQKALEERMEKEVRQQARAEMREVQAKMGKEMEAMSAYVIEKLLHMENQVAKAIEAGASAAAQENKVQSAALETHQNALLKIQQLALQTKNQLLAGVADPPENLEQRQL